MYEYQIVNAINNFLAYFQNYIYPLLWVIVSAILSCFTLSLLRWYRNK